MKKAILVAVVITPLAITTSEAQVQLMPPGQAATSPAQIVMNAQPAPPGPPAPVDGQVAEPLAPPTFVPPPPGPPARVDGPGAGQVPPPALVPPYAPQLRVYGPVAAPLPAPVFVPYPTDVRGCPWLTVDYMLCWVKPGPNPNPLVTTGPSSDPSPATLGPMGPNTKILFGDHNLDYGSFSGARIDAGFWLPQCPVIGLEANFFALQTRSVNFSAFSDPNGDQILGRPVIIVTNGQSPIEQVYLDSWPGQSSGGVSVSSNSQFDSWEINVVANLLRTRSLDWDLTVGFRSLDLIENLRIEDVAFPLSNAAGFTFLGSPVGPPSTLADFDHFRTTNHFYGGQLGSKLVWSEGLVDVGLTAKVALGATQQGINIDGGSVLLTPSSPPVTAPGGILAQPTNMGLTYRSVFTVVPEVGLNLGYQITPWLRAQVGYTFLYWSDVVRPGNQIDRAVNPSQVPTDQTYVGSTGTVPARPTLTPQTTDFWVQGINFGLEFRF